MLKKKKWRKKICVWDRGFKETNILLFYYFLQSQSGSEFDKVVAEVSIDSYIPSTIHMRSQSP